MNSIKLDISKVYSFASEKSIVALKTKAEAANKALHDKSGKGNDFLGWVNLPSSILYGSGVITSYSRHYTKVYDSPYRYPGTMYFPNGPVPGTKDGNRHQATRGLV